MNVNLIARKKSLILLIRSTALVMMTRSKNWDSIPPVSLNL